MTMKLLSLFLLAGSVSALDKSHNTTNATKVTSILSSPSGLGDAFQPIVGGQQASQGRYPFFVQGNGCGATLVWADIVLTAAHCNGRFRDQVLVSAERKYWPQGGAVYKRTLSSMILHPKNQVGTYIYDFMMFRIEPVDGFESKIMQTNSNAGSPVEGELLTVIGMGYTREGGPSSEVLNQVDVMAYSHSQCTASYGSSILPEAMLCAGWPQGGKDSCNGDSGAPIFNGNGVQVGLTSFGSGCARAGKPGVYARVSVAKDWIDQTICSLSAMPPSWCFPQPVTTTRSPTRPPTRPPTPAPVPVPTTRPPTFAPILAPRPPTPQPTANFQQQGVSISSLATTTYRIVVQYDRHPHQVKWFIRHRRTKIIQYDYFSGVQQFGVVTESLPLQSGRRYALVVRDQGGDGFCCDQGPGKIDIIATVNGVDQTVVSMLGDIGWYKKLTFVAP